MSRLSRKKKKVADRDVKLLLQETIRHLGKVGDVVSVKPGYARNFLVPKGLGVQPTPTALKNIEAKRQEYERFEAAQREKQQSLLTKLDGYTVTLVRRANERGHLYGGVGASDIAHALSEAGMATNDDVTITADEINLHGKIDNVGSFTSDVRFADDLMQEITVEVQADEESKAQMKEYEAEVREREAAAQAAEQAEAAAAAAAPRA